MVTGAVDWCGSTHPSATSLKAFRTSMNLVELSASALVLERAVKLATASLAEVCTLYRSAVVFAFHSC